MSVHGINIDMSDNPNHYFMLIGIFGIIIGSIIVVFPSLGVNGYLAVVSYAIGIAFLSWGFANLKDAYTIRNNLDMNLKRKALGFELKIPKDEKLKK